MRYVISNCYDQRDHAIHVSSPRHSMHSCVDSLEIRLCPGGRIGDKRVRDSDDIAALCDEVRLEEESRTAIDLIGALEQVIGRPVDRTPTSYDDGFEPPEPEEDWDGYEADRAADRYERDVLGL